ncbi:MAG: epoxyqueuosine reductase QueH [Synergistaceae bacterium]|nr:epoxyqueuosine reductase QueH [Synergistaceae bacterium]
MSSDALGDPSADQPGVGRFLLHVCCAPDASVPWPSLMAEGFDVCGFFYGDNIHPEEEWRRRIGAVRALSRILGASAAEGDYRPSRWFAEASALAGEPEGGKRCALCFRRQLDATAEYAARNGFRYAGTTLTISPHKDPALINVIGEEACRRLGVEWVPRVWRKGGGFALSVRRSREWGLYRQNYCGCVYSFRDGGEKGQDGDG